MLHADEPNDETTAYERLWTVVEFALAARKERERPWEYPRAEVSVDDLYKVLNALRSARQLVFVCATCGEPAGEHEAGNARFPLRHKWGMTGHEFKPQLKEEP